MKIPFQKYQGTGNDFVIIDNRTDFFPKYDMDLIQHMCHRKWGIGADGLMLIENGVHEDFEMIFFNPDGSKSLCGNGSRCAVAFASTLGLAKDRTTFTTTDGKHIARLENGIIHFQIHDIKKVEQKGADDFFIFNGSPHHVRFVEAVSKIDILTEGPKVRHHPDYAPGGTNVNFVSIKNEELHVRTFERGVENETLSCGTGVVASAIAGSFKGLSSPIQIQTKGGTLSVSFEKSDGVYQEVFLSGPAKKVFEGTFTVED